jgi:23S rRNA pseudouridine1911/1915/1917 synthase
MEVGPRANKEAVTEFEVVRRGKDFSILKVYPLTGRTHQIRSHMVYIGHPVVGDIIYGGPDKINGRQFGRQLLHAQKISFIHPSKNKRVEFEAPLPEDMEKL